MTRKRGLPPPTRKGRGIKVPARTGIKSPRQRKNAKSTINRIRDLTYSANKVLGDMQALNTGNIAGRIERRLTGKIAAQGLGSNILKFFQK